MKSFSYTELDLLAGEILPERAVLSTLLVGGGSNDNDNANFNVNHGGSDGSTIVVPVCQGTVYHNQGLLGLVAAHDSSSFTCAGATVVSGH
jgi:hypothetical protein